MSANPSEQAAKIIGILDPVYGRLDPPVPLPNDDGLDRQSNTGLFVNVRPPSRSMLRNPWAQWGLSRLKLKWQIDRHHLIEA